MRKKFVFKSCVSENLEEQTSDLLAWYRQFKQFGILRRLKSYYDVGQKIGNGNFSNVFEATQIQTGQKFAIKSIEKRVLVKTNKNFVILNGHGTLFISSL